MEVSLAEVKADIEKYLDLADTQDILITKEGKKIAKLVKLAEEEEEYELVKKVREMKKTCSFSEIDDFLNEAEKNAKTEEDIIAIRVASMEAVAGCITLEDDFDIDKVRMERII
jgi:antitoxin (DNA-binding transcriptional repressor) of toxin-antitoxin stability system